MLKHFSLILISSVVVIILSSFILLLRNQQPTTNNHQPPIGCYYQQVQCIKAPCDPILVCPTITPTSTYLLKNPLRELNRNSDGSVTYYNRSNITNKYFSFSAPPSWYSKPDGSNYIFFQTGNSEGIVKIDAGGHELGGSYDIIRNFEKPIGDVVVRYYEDKDPQGNIFAFYNLHKDNFELIFEAHLPSTYLTKFQQQIEQLILSVKFYDSDPSLNLTPTHNSQPSTYTCPPSGWVDCMPGPGPAKPQCQRDHLDWIKANCPDFEGVAY